MALAAGSARAGLPRGRGDQPGHRGHRRLPPGRERDGEVDRDREHVPLPGLLACFAQLGAAAIHFVGGRPGERDARIRGGGNHRGALRGLGGELGLVRDVRPLSPLTVVAPGLRQIEPEVEQGVGTSGHVGGEHDGLAVFHLPGDPGMLPAYPHTGLAFLQLRGLIQHHDRPWITQPRHDEPLQRGQRRRPVPGVLGQQSLHPPRRGMPGRLRQLPARPAIPRLGQQRPDIRERRQPRPGLREHPRQQPEQLPSQLSQPGPVFYDGTGGHLIVSSSHEA